MEKPWMPGLLDTLQAPPPKQPPTGPASERENEEPTRKQNAHENETEVAHESETPAFRTPLSDDSARRSNTFADIFESSAVQPSRPTLGYAGDTPWEESWSHRLVARAPAITIVVLFVAGLAILSFFYRVQVGHSLVRLGEKISGEPVQQAAIAAPAPQASAPPVQPTLPTDESASAQPVAPPSNPPTAKANDGASAAADSSVNADITTKGNMRAQTAAATPTSSAQAKSTEEESDSQSSAAPSDGQAEFRVAHAALAQASTPQERAKAADLLWAAVSQGSSDAEVELADVYASGAGVARNCQQARILLNAATDKHNPLASDESAKLRGYGCR